ncbi:alpha/beta hydrolase [Iamia majanohamensis]|uniref:Alpha/beta hydrolase n=1 Tax=Iamia majanohamensis TaxID=467976 RepID=A0AAE9YCK7_9ACTN|nr:alpha/beta hydrolase [Iamia majanohamensis]WCO66362.1 alpha/beta hydrolase [Iamia majanohamensis]
MLPRRARSVAVVLVVALALAGCGDGRSETTECSDGAGMCAGGPTTTTGPPGDGGGERIAVDGGEALVWGDGPQGVLLAHGAAFDAASWQDLATRISEGDGTALAVEDISADGIRTGIEALRARDVAQVILLGGSAGADAILEVASADPGVADGLILLSPNREVEGLGEEPKLFIASEGEPVSDVAETLAESAPGEENDTYLVEGDAHAQHILDADGGPGVAGVILARLDRWSPA